MNTVVSNWCQVYLNYRWKNKMKFEINISKYWKSMYKRVLQSRNSQINLQRVGARVFSRDTGQIDWSGNPLYAIKILATLELRRLCEGYIEDIGFHEQRDGSFLRLSEDGERKSCEPAVRWNIRHNTFRIVLEGDVVKRSANNARDLCVGRGVEASHSSPLLLWTPPTFASPPTSGKPGKGCLQALARLPPTIPENSKGHQRKSPERRCSACAAIWFAQSREGLETIMSTNSCVANRFVEIARGRPRIGLEDPLDISTTNRWARGSSVDQICQEST